MQNWMDNWPRGHRFTTELLLDGGGGSGGGTQTTQTQAQHMPWSQYVPPETYTLYKKGLDFAGKKMGEGLDPEALEQFRAARGQVLTDTGVTFGGAGKELGEQLARTGVKGGALAESYSDLARQKAIASATGLSGVEGQRREQDILEKRRNLEEARRWVGVPGSPIQTGSTSTTTSQPTGGGGMS